MTIQLSPIGGDDAPQISAALATGQATDLSGATFSIQSAITAPGPFLLRGSGASSVLSLDYAGPMFTFSGLSRFAMHDFRAVGNWQANQTCLELDSIAHSTIERLSFDQWPNVLRLNTSGQNSAFNVFRGLDLGTFINGIYVNGSVGKHATLNTFDSIRGWGRANGIAHGIVFDQYADNNWLSNTYLALSFAASVGIEFNQATPAVDVEVYENHAHNLVIDSFTAGDVVGIKAGVLHEPGAKDYPTRITVRYGGGNPIINEITSGSDVRFLASNHDGELVGSW